MLSLECILHRCSLAKWSTHVKPDGSGCKAMFAKPAVDNDSPATIEPWKVCESVGSAVHGSINRNGGVVGA